LLKAYDSIESKIDNSIKVWIEGEAGYSSVRALTIGIFKALHQKNIRDARKISKESWPKVKTGIPSVK
jgi:hypothetical protein